MNTQYKKLIRDLTSDSAKNIMLALAIAIGIFGIGTILGGYGILKREMAWNYAGTHPASATIKIDGGSFDRSLVDSISRMEGIAQAERRTSLTARMKIGSDWYPLLLFVVDDFRNMTIGTVSHVSGAVVPPLGTMLVERTSHRTMLSEDGKEVVVKTPTGTPHTLRISGTVHDPGLAPAWQEKCGYGYITLSTLQFLGEGQGFDELKIIVPESQQSAENITARAKRISAWLNQRGLTIHEVQIPPPNRHPHQGQMNAVLLLFTVFSFLLLILSSILVSTTIATLMVKQIREIGIMKSIGATSRMVSQLYLSLILTLCIPALLIGIPLSRFAALEFAERIAVLLNLKIFDRTIPTWVLFVQMGSGIFIPLLAALVPVIKGSVISIRTAFDHYGVSQDTFVPNSIIPRLTSTRFFGEILSLALRNVFRQRSRVLMTIGLLSAGGAMFLTALNVSQAWDINLQKIYRQRFYDVDIRLHRSFPANDIRTTMKRQSGVQSIELWNYSPTSLISDVSFPVVQTYPDKGHGSFLIVGLPVATPMIKLPIMEGRWLNSETGNDVVLNHMARALAPDLKIGDSVSLFLEHKPGRWRIVGFAEDLYSPATAYISTSSFRQSGSGMENSNMIRLTFTNRDPGAMHQRIRSIEDSLNQEHMSLSQCIPVTLLRNAIGEHMGVLIYSLMGMAILMAVVGTLGLTSTMSMNIMERTREIGVMRALGAAPATIRTLILYEAFFIGLLSLFLAFGLSMLLSISLGQFLGTMAFRSPLSLSISLHAIVLWMGILFAGSIGATLVPIRRTNRMTAREALAYE